MGSYLVMFSILIAKELSAGFIVIRYTQLVCDSRMTVEVQRLIGHVSCNVKHGNSRLRSAELATTQ